ncbi:MAG: endonuclease/exonuclease/phosphatase family protein [Candidatus Aminicenantes bacterium]|nr:endonuclease/exonuclease/phosphatase family protein [Candidatus Aminicenantes bacterium]
MAKAFSLASWNVEHFKDDDTRVKRVIKFLQAQNPDVFGLLEVEGREVFSALVKEMPDYQFHITEGPQVQEVLVGVRNGITAFFTQKTEYKAGIQTLRPGALLTVTIDGEHYPILFLHTKSSSLPLGLGIRDDQFRRAFKFKRTLDKAGGGAGKSNYIFLGDMNVMGMKYPFKKDINPPFEVKKLDADAKKVRMRRLAKNKPYAWWNGPGSKYEPADLDQVVASEQLKFRQIGGADIDVRGWPALGSTNQQAEWIKKYSDHGLLYLEVEK